MSTKLLNRYQVTLNLGRTDTVELMSDSLLDVKSIYKRFSMSTVTIVKRYDYVNPSPQYNDFINSYRELKILVGCTSKSLNKFVIVRFVKTTVTMSDVIKLCKSHLFINDYPVDYVHSMIRNGY